MIACDVNVLVHAANVDHERHEEFRGWVEGAANGVEPFGIPTPVASGFLRIVTHPRILTRPVAPSVALAALDDLLAAPATVRLDPGPRHWTIFVDLVRTVGARGNAVPDAFLAALALEHGCEWITADRGFARYPGLRSRHPLDA